MAPNNEGLPERRYRLLVKQLHEEVGETKWKEKVGRRLGVTGAFIGMVVRGDRPGAAKAQQAAIDKLGLDYRFFHEPSLGDSPSYRDHIVKGAEAHWQTFVRRYERIDALSPSQLDAIKDFQGRSGRAVRSWQQYAELADIILRDEPSEVHEKKK